MPDQLFLDYFTVWRHPKGVRTVNSVGWPEGSEVFLFSFGLQGKSLPTLLMTVCT